MSLFNVELIADQEILKVGFGDEPSSNDLIIVEAQTKVKEIKTQIHGMGLKITGACSLPISMMIAHEISHVTKWVACFDPKLGAYVICVSHDPKVRVGDVIK